MSACEFLEILAAQKCGQYSVNGWCFICLPYGAWRQARGSWRRERLPDRARNRTTGRPRSKVSGGRLRPRASSAASSFTPPEAELGHGGGRVRSRHASCCCTISTISEKADASSQNHTLMWRVIISRCENGGPLEAPSLASCAGSLGKGGLKRRFDAIDLVSAMIRQRDLAIQSSTGSGGRCLRAQFRSGRPGAGLISQMTCVLPLNLSGIEPFAARRVRRSIVFCSRRAMLSPLGDKVRPATLLVTGEFLPSADAA